MALRVICTDTYWRQGDSNNVPCELDDMVILVLYIDDSGITGTIHR